MSVRPLLVLGPAALALAFGAQPAVAASNGLRFDPDAGQAIPLAGTKTAVDLACPQGKSDCVGKVELVPRGPAAADLGIDPVATSGKLTADPGEDAEPRLGLSAAARQWISDNGPLPVTAEVEGPGPDPSRALFVEEPTWVTAPDPTHKPLGVSPAHSLATASAESNFERFQWKFELKPGTAVKLRDFRCPSSAPWIMQRHAAWFPGGRPGDISLVVSDGVGFGSFKDVHAQRYSYGYNDYWLLQGWPEGDFFSNNFFAPVFKSGTVKMSLTCTNVDFTEPDGAANLRVESDLHNAYPTSWLLPWNSPRK
jgi:hypothetical protein